MKKCPNCEKDFEPNSGKQKFCSDKCKVAFARKTAKGIVGVTTADKIPEPTIKWWITLVETYCEAEGITPEDLISSHKERFKAVKSKKGTNTSKSYEIGSTQAGSAKNNTNWFNLYRQNKTGIK